MGWWPFGRDRTQDKNVEYLLAEAHSAGRSTAAPPAPAVARAGDGTFRLPVEDVFKITGRGTVVTGRVEAGIATVGMQVHLVRAGTTVLTTTITGIEKFRDTTGRAEVGDTVGLLLDGLVRETVHHGDVISG